jgi:3-deoxy-7-phosphoheptulonate synthase
MIIVMRAGAGRHSIDDVRERVEALGLRTTLSRHGGRFVIGCLGDAPETGCGALERSRGVARIVTWPRPYRLASRALREERTVVRVGSEVACGGAELLVVAGPCAVEDAAMLSATARAVRAAGARALRGGAFKPRTSPYAFQGLGVEALRLLAAARRETGLPIVTEVMDTRHVEVVAEVADVLQIGARNMQNFALLAEVGRVRRPVLLKRGLSATLTELLLAAEHIMARGNGEVILCERGIRTFERATRNTLDVAAIPVLKRETHLPVIVDPSHAAGQADLVPALACAAVAAGADGLLVEVHPHPEAARSDGEQSLTPAAFAAMLRLVAPFAAAAGRTVAVAAPLTREAAA